MAKSFLLVGISFDEVPSSFTEKVRAALAHTENQFHKAGLDYEFLEYSSTENMDRLNQTLVKKDYAAVLVGAGIRLNERYTQMLEELVNTIRTKSPESMILFNSKPDNAFEAVERWFKMSTDNQEEKTSA